MTSKPHQQQQQSLFRPKFTPIPSDVDIPHLVHSTPNFQWVHREDARLHAAPYQALNQIIHAVTIEQGLPIVVDNWHLRQDWPAQVFSKEWLKREHGDEDIVVRDLIKAQDIWMSTADYLALVPSLSTQNFTSRLPEPKEKPPRRQYGKDIDCPQEWRGALTDLLPQEVSYLGANDLMTKLPPEARAENMMIYIGHEGTYTPAHKDMCATYGQNIMVYTAPSPNGIEGLAYWFVFSARDRKRVADYWNTLGHDIDTENFFASLDDLKGFPGNVWVIEQRLGDFVIIPPLAAHQVYNHGGMTMKAAWNRTTIDTLELSISETLPAYRHVCRDEQYKNKAIVHQSLLELSRFPPQTLISSPFKHDSFMRLFRLYTRLLVDEFIPADDYGCIRMEKIKQEFNVQCSFCRTNIWNRFLTCKQCIQLDKDGDIDSYDICLECFSRGRSCRDITGLEWVQQEKWSDLMNLWERCRGIYQFLGGEDIDDFTTETTVNLGRKTLAAVCMEELRRRPNPHGKMLTPLKEGHCHTCKVRHPVWKMAYCNREGCRNGYCFGNLFRQFDEDPFEILAKVEGYTCPVCRGICNCGACRKRKDQVGYEPKLRSAQLNPKLVADPRSIESLVDSNRTNTRWHLETKGALTAKSQSEDPEPDPEPSAPHFERSPTIPAEFPDNSSLDPSLGLIDPEIRNYFFKPDSHGPPPYSEVDTNPHSGEQFHSAEPWLAVLDTYDSFIAQPLNQHSTIDPSLFGPSPFAQQPTPQIFSPSRPIYDEPRISPALLGKPSPSPVAAPVKWYSGGKEVVSKKAPPLRRSREQTQASHSPVEIQPPAPDPPVKQWEVNVETGLDTIKRIKLIFRESPGAPSSRPASSGQFKGFAPDIGDGRVTPPAACGVEEKELPYASELHLDDNTPPPEMKRRRLDENVSVVIHRREIERELYPVWLATDAKQVWIRKKKTGRVKGVIYDWNNSSDGEECTWD